MRLIISVKCRCGDLPDCFPASVRRTPELVDCLVKIYTDYQTLTTLFRCKGCGQLWEERYENKGHGEIPSVRKVFPLKMTSTIREEN